MRIAAGMGHRLRAGLLLALLLPLGGCVEVFGTATPQPAIDNTALSGR